MTLSPKLSVVIPAYNESAILAETLQRVTSTIDRDFPGVPVEILVVDDGSRDDTRTIALAFRDLRLRVLAHETNLGFGEALKSAFREARGDYIILLDADLSYEPSHISRLYAAAIEKQADIVIASPFMKGGQTSGVPTDRLVLSRAANIGLWLASLGKFRTATGMVRAYRREFICSLELRSRGMEINLEILLSAIRTNALVHEIPAELRWDVQRISSMRVSRHISQVLKYTIYFLLARCGVFPPAEETQLCAALTTKGMLAS